MSRSMRTACRILLMAALFAAIAAISVFRAQESASFKLHESVLNSGGSPIDGSSPASASFRISQDALGGGIGYRALSGTSFRMDPNFVAAYRPAGEVTGLMFSDAQTLAWDGERAAAVYSIYRDSLAGLSGMGYGSCLATDIPTTTTTDVEVPLLSEGFFYLVASRNRLDEEGGKGFDSDGAERPNPAPCP